MRNSAIAASGLRKAHGDKIAVAWCAGIALAGYLWSLSTCKKRA